MPSDQDEVPAGAVIAAMELVKGLGDNENAMPGDETSCSASSATPASPPRSSPKASRC
jgi:hypothetical protein